MTVASLATTTHSRPWIRPMPVTIAGARHGVVVAGRRAVHPERRQRAQLEERAAGVEQPVDPVAHEQLAAVGVLGPRGLAPATAYDGEVLAELVHEAAETGRRRWSVTWLG